MSAPPQDRVDALTREILVLGDQALRPSAVTVMKAGAGEQSEVVVHVELTSASERWNADRFRALRRAARTIATDVLFDVDDVRLVYEEAPVPLSDDSAAV